MHQNTNTTNINLIHDHHNRLDQNYSTTNPNPNPTTSIYYPNDNITHNINHNPYHTPNLYIHNNPYIQQLQLELYIYNTQIAMQQNPTTTLTTTVTTINSTKNNCNHIKDLIGHGNDNSSNRSYMGNSDIGIDSNITIRNVRPQTNSQQLLKIYNLLSQILQSPSIISSTTTSSLAQAQQTLQKLSTQSPQFLNNLLSILLISGISRQICQLVLVYCKKYVENLINSGSGSSSNTLIGTVVQIIVQYLSGFRVCGVYMNNITNNKINISNNIDDTNIIDSQYKNHLLETLTLIFQKQRSKTLLISWQKQLNGYLEDIVHVLSTQSQTRQSQSSAVNVINYQFIAFLAYAVVESIPVNGMVNHLQFLENSFGKLIAITNAYTQLLYTTTNNTIIQQQQSIQQQQPPSPSKTPSLNTHISQPTLTHLSYKLPIVSKYLDILYKYIKKLKSINLHVRTLVDTQAMCGMIEGLMGFRVFVGGGGGADGQSFLAYMGGQFGYGYVYGVKGNCGNGSYANRRVNKIINIYYEIKTKTIKILHECTTIVYTKSSYQYQQWQQSLESRQIINPNTQTYNNNNKQNRTRQSAILTKSPKFIQNIINSLNALYSSNTHTHTPTQPHHHHHQQSHPKYTPQLTQLIEQCLTYLESITKSNKFYRLILENKYKIIFGILIKILMFDLEEYQRFRGQPQEFVNMVYQIVNMGQQEGEEYQGEFGFGRGKGKKMIGKEKKMGKVGSNDGQVDKSQINESNMSNLQSDIMQSQQQQPSYNNNQTQQNQLQQPLNSPQTLKTLSSTLLKTYITYIDGTLPELIILSLNILQSKTSQTTYPKHLILLILCILKNYIKLHGNFRYALCAVLSNMLRYAAVPVYFQMGGGGKDRVVKRGDIAEMGMGMNRVMNIMGNQNISTNLHQSIEYSILLITFDVYIPILEQNLQNIINSLYYIIKQIMTNNHAEPAVKIIASRLLVKIIRSQEGAQFCEKIGEMVLSCLDDGNSGCSIKKDGQEVWFQGKDERSLSQLQCENQGQLRYLQCLYIIIKQNSRQLVYSINLVKQIITKITKLLIKYIQPSTSTPTTHKKPKTLHNHPTNPTITNKIDKMWHILQQLSTNKYLINLIYPYLYESLSQLIKYVTYDNQMILEQRVYPINVNLMRIVKGITHFQVDVVRICKVKFYGGIERNGGREMDLGYRSQLKIYKQSKYSLALYFQVLQYILYYGRTTLSAPQSQQPLYTILTLSLASIQQQLHPQTTQTPRSQSQYCQGILLLQTLIITYNKIFPKQIWYKCLQILWNKIKNGNVTYDFMKAQLLTCVALVLSYGWKLFQNGDLDVVLKQILNVRDCWSYKNTTKVYIIAMISLLQYQQIPFIMHNYNKLLQTILILLQHTQKQKDKIFQNQVQDCQQHQYDRLKSQSINDLSHDSMDLFEYFYAEVEKIKSNSVMNKIGVYQAAYNGLSEGWKMYMREIFRLRKVGNSLRVIYRFKQSKKQ